jgi:hypothetical protein
LQRQWIIIIKKTNPSLEPIARLTPCSGSAFRYNKKMIKKYIIVSTICVSLLIGCSMGGGGGVYYPPQVAINEISVTKKEIQESIINEKTKIYVKDQEQLIKTEANIKGDKYYYFREFNFTGKQYRVGISLFPWFSIIDSDNNVVLKLELPRYSTSAAALELVGKNGTQYLVVYVNQQATSHSSTLFIISDGWRVLYKEHLLGAKWISKSTSKYGDVLIVSAEKQWAPKDECISVGGPWRYIIFKK